MTRIAEGLGYSDQYMLLVIEGGSLGRSDMLTFIGAEVSYYAHYLNDDPVANDMLSDKQMALLQQGIAEIAILNIPSQSNKPPGRDIITYHFLTKDNFITFTDETLPGSLVLTVSLARKIRTNMLQTQYLHMLR